VIFNRDRFNNADTAQSAQAAMTVIDRLQQFPPEEQLVGLAAAFLLLTSARTLLRHAVEM